MLDAAPTAWPGRPRRSNALITRVSTAQHQFFDRVVLSVSQSRADLHEAAWTALGFLLVLGMVGLLGLWWCLFHGGLALSEPRGRGSNERRRAFQHTD